MKTKLLIGVMVQFFASSWAQNLNFSDAKFKALILTSNATNGIAKNASGVSIAIDTNNDGEVQLSEAQNVVILDVKMDETQKYDSVTGEINYPYYFNHLPTTISDALLFTNVEELYISDTKNANISFVNNSKIKKVMCMNRWFSKEETFNGNYYESDFYPVDFTIDNCPSLLSMDDISAFYHPYFMGQAIFRIKNNPQLNGALVLNNRLITELYFENTNFTSININDSRGLMKLSVPDMSTLQSINITNTQDGLAYNQEIDLVANNCTALQEIILDGDNYDSHSVYLKAINVNGCSALKKIKGLNAPNINFSSAGLLNLEELDCAYYNRYIYTGHQDGFVYWGNVAAVNLSGLPKLKTFKAFNQIFSAINLLQAPTLEFVDITNTTDKMSSLSADNLQNLQTFYANLTRAASDSFGFNLQTITAKNCSSLTDLKILGHQNLTSVNLKNCSSLQSFAYGNNYFEAGHQLSNIDFSGCSAMKNVLLFNTHLQSLNLTDCTNLETLDLGNNYELTKLLIKNDAHENVTIYPSLNVEICADDFQVSEIQSNYPDANVSNCDAVLGTNDLNSNDVSFYPNPAKDFVNLKSDKEIQNIAIFDAQGKLIKSLRLNQKSSTINISNLPNGVYYFKVKTPEKELMKKVIKN